MKRCLGCMKVYGDSYQICPHCGYVEGTDAKENFYMLPGSILSKRYIVGKALGYGGFGITYVAWDELLEKRVAIKEYLPSEFSTRIPGQTRVTVFSNEKEEQFNLGIKKFVEEARRLMKFRSVPGIVQFFNCFEENGTAYIVMEYLEGETLKEKLEREKTIPVDEALNIIMPVIESLEEVHKEGIIHRDIAPDNIFITKEPKMVKLIDFGASRYATSTHSKSLSVLIKEGYAPEEQYRGRDQGPWTDVYSVAATFYKMVTGITPQDSMERNIKDKIKLPSKLGVDIPKNIENAIMNALNRKVEDRTKDCAELKKELLDVNNKRNFVKQRKIDIGRWPLWAKVSSGIAGFTIVTMIVLLSTGIIKFDFLDSIRSILGQNDVEVPEVIGRTKDEAEKKLDDRELIVQYIDYIENDEIPGDCVYSQTPGANERIKKGDTVFLTLSCGEQAKKMINTVGYNAENMKKKLEKLGVSVRFEYESGNGAKDSVIRQLAGNEEIAGNAEIKKGMVVTLVVSNGSEEIDESLSTTVPDFTGKTYLEALELAKNSNIYIMVKGDKISENVLKGQVMNQSEACGTVVQAGTIVKLTRSRGNTVTVPNFLLKSKDEIESIAKAANVKYEITYVESDNVAKDLVVSQSIEKNKEIKCTEVVKLAISKGNNKAEKYTQPVEDATTKQTATNRTEQQTTAWVAEETMEKQQETTKKQQETTKKQQEATEKQQETTKKQQETTEKIPEAPSGWTEDTSFVDNKYYSYETKVQYLPKTREKREETTTSASSTMDGWTLYDSKYDISWGNPTAYSTQQATSETFQYTGETQEKVGSHVEYEFVRFYSDAYGDFSTWQRDATYNRESAWARDGQYHGPFSYHGGTAQCYWVDGCTQNYPFVQSGGVRTVDDYATMYWYRSGEKIYTYYFKRVVYGDWNTGKWTDTKPKESATCKIEKTRTLYKYTRK